MYLRTFFIVCLFFGLLTKVNAQGIKQKITVSGYVTDETNGEAFIGATVAVKGSTTGTVTNLEGFYSLTLDRGEYTLVYQFVGYKAQEVPVSLTENQRISIELIENEVTLQEVVVLAESKNANVTNVEMSVNKLDIQTMEKMPALLGEVDVIKSIQLLPGVSTVGEGASGFNVRGGSVGQNLILLDDAPVYNSSHLFGIFSVFNPDAVKDVKLYKGGIPAKYGGRLASILDVRMKEGNSKKFEVNGGVGLIFSRLALEGPIIKNKASFIVAGRRSYGDILAAPFIDNASLYFYDLTGKVNYNINRNNKIFLSGYLGRDVFAADENTSIGWGNQTATLRWNHIFSNKLFLHTSLVYANYDYELGDGQNINNRVNWESHVRTYDFKPEFTYYINPNNELSFGGNALLYRFDPAQLLDISEGSSTNIGLDERRGLETSVYISNKQDVAKKVSLEYGVRFSAFQYLGDGTVYEFEEVVPGIRPNVTSAEETDLWESIETYTNVEPRFSMRYSLSEKSSIKASYNRMAQYIHLVSNTAASIPLDVWLPSTNNIEPQVGDQLALGYFRNFGEDNAYEFSAEAYYKSTQNQLDYLDGADLLINAFVEGEVLSGEGRAYGLELYAKKNTGRLTGWLSYTLSRSELQVEGINNGEWYPTLFDQTHNFKAVGFYDFNERLTFSANFTYVTGAPVTFPTSRYEVQGFTIPHTDNDERNGFRINDFHRLDLSLTLKGRKFKKNGRERRNEDYWTLSLFNVYARQNAFSIYFSQSDAEPAPGQGAITEANRFSVLGTIIPSVSYNFKF
ncbi:MAG: carboxypeptidase-like regulatory domain-containing protein [Cyclobacteriaceae bacterium]